MSSGGLDGGDGESYTGDPEEYDGYETDDALLSNIDLGQFLTGSSSLDGVDFRAADGINAVRVAQAAVGAVAFALLWGVNSLIAAVTGAYARIIDAVASFSGGLIQSTLGVGISAVEGVWSFTLTEFGLFAYPIALSVVLATFYVADEGITAAREVLR
jgi:hypothetical protein